MQTQSNLYSVIRIVLVGNLKLSTLFTLFLQLRVEQNRVKIFYKSISLCETPRTNNTFIYKLQ